MITARLSPHSVSLF